MPTTPAPTTRRTVTVPALAAELRVAVMRTSRRLRQERSTDDVTPGQYSVLALLSNGPLTPRELADRERVQPPSMTRTLALLEQLELVVRTDHPSDGRQVLVSLSEAGRVVVHETRRRRDAWLALRLAELDPAERDLLARASVVLARLADS
jgi:DNA-binding MarR family transcriptional regulator